MSSERHDGPAEMTPTSSPGNPGETLRAARLERELTVAQVALELRISAQAVGFIEAGQFERLPGDIFARGYIRSYARLMLLDANRLAGEFDAYRGIEAHERRVATISRVAAPSRGSRSLMRWTTLLMVLALLASAFWWYQSVQPKTEPLPVSDSDSDSGLMDEVEVDALLLPHALAVQAEAAVVAATVDQTVDLDEATSTPEAAPSVLEAEAPSSSPGLYLQVSADCWVQLAALNGEVLHSGLLRAGELLDLNPSGAFDLVIGDRSAVTEIRFQGKPVTLPPRGQSGVVRMRLGEQGSQ